MPDQPSIPDYTLLRPIGRGAYGEVWLARSVTGLHRAVKIVRRDRFGDPRPFEREFAGIRRFEPASIGQESQVALLHVGRNDEAGFFYYVMELADDVETGEEIFPDRYVPKTLKELRARRQRLAAEDAVGVGLALTRALVHLHQAGLVHRDIKPSNIIFVHGVPKLADVGLVSAMDSSHSFVGTEGFVPPEGPGTAAADVYSLGKVLYEIGTGRDRTEFPDLPENLEALPDRRLLLELNEVILKACDRDLARRYSSAESMQEDLLLIQAGRSVRRLQVVERRLKLIAKYGVAATLISALAIASFLWASAQTRLANQNLERAERAELDAEARLQEAKFNWARANRLTGRPGQRFDSLAELARISARTNQIDLRNEAIACLALPDVRPVKQWAKTPWWDSFNFSHDFRLYGTNDATGAIFIRDRLTDALCHTLPSQGAPLAASVSSPDGRYLATHDRSNRVWLWSIATESARELPEGSDVKLIGFTPDNRSLILVRDGELVEFINVTSGDVEQTLSGLAAARRLQISSSGELLLSVESNRVHIFERSDGSLVRTVALPETVGALIWHPDGSRFAATWSRHIGVWEVATGRQRAVMVGHETSVVGLAFIGPGDWLASTSWDGTTRVWQTDAGREVLKLDLGGNNLRVSADGAHLAFKSWDNQRVHLYELADLSLARRFGVPVSGFASRAIFSPDGQQVVVVNDSAVSVFRPPAAGPAFSLPVTGSAAAAFEPEGRALVTCGGRGLRRWPVLRDASGAMTGFGPREVVEPTYLKPIHYFQFSGDGRWCVTSLAQGGPFFAFDYRRSNSVVQAQAEVWPGHLLDVSRDGRLAASWSERQPGRIQIWNPQTGGLVTNLESNVEQRHAAFSPDQRWMAASSVDSVVLRTLPDWQIHHRLPHPALLDSRFRVAFSPDSQVLAAVMSDREVGLIHLATGRMEAALPVDRLVTSLAFSPAGDTLAVTFESGWFQWWDLRHLHAQLHEMNLGWASGWAGRSRRPL